MTDMSRTTVELSVPATSEELKLLAAAAELRRLSLRDFLRLSVRAAANAAARPHRGPGRDAPSARTGPPRPQAPALTPAFLP
jgi:hypothetical protein